MPVIDEHAMQELRDSLGNIYYRANRLNEWREFGIVLNKLQGRLDALKKQMEGAGAAQKADLLDAIETCRYTDLLEIRNFVEGIRFIERPLNANGNGTSLGFIAWLDTLEQAGQQMAHEVGDDNFGAAKGELKKMSRQLSAIVIKRQVLLEFEIGDLRVFSRSLYDKLT